MEVFHELFVLSSQFALLSFEALRSGLLMDTTEGVSDATHCELGVSEDAVRLAVFVCQDHLRLLEEFIVLNSSVAALVKRDLTLADVTHVRFCRLR